MSDTCSSSVPRTERTRSGSPVSRHRIGRIAEADHQQMRYGYHEDYMSSTGAFMVVVAVKDGG